jgi:hypothetical protein
VQLDQVPGGVAALVRLREQDEVTLDHLVEVHVQARDVPGVILVQAGALVDRLLETLTRGSSIIKVSY